MDKDWSILQDFMIDNAKDQEFIFFDDSWYYILWKNDNTIRLGHFFYYSISVPISELKNCKIYKAKSYKDLKRKYGIDAFLDNTLNKNVYWLAPNGDIYNVEAHSIDAIGICEWLDIPYYKDDNYDCSDTALNALLDRGWIRLSTYFWTMYSREYQFGWKMTSAQRDKIWDFCYEHNLEYPDDIIRIIN